MSKKLEHKKTRTHSIKYINLKKNLYTSTHIICSFLRLFLLDLINYIIKELKYKHVFSAIQL